MLGVLGFLHFFEMPSTYLYAYKLDANFEQFREAYCARSVTIPTILIYIIFACSDSVPSSLISEAGIFDHSRKNGVNYWLVLLPTSISSNTSRRRKKFGSDRAIF